jgi:hypothetical protein
VSPKKAQALAWLSFGLPRLAMAEPGIADGAARAALARMERRQNWRAISFGKCRPQAGCRSDRFGPNAIP